MKQTALLFLLALTIGLLLPASSADAKDTRTLVGKYAWNVGARGDLKAIFTATGEESWKVAFHFEFRGRKHVYKGTAEGGLSEGELKGQVKTRNGSRTFTFTGAFEGGRFAGTHAEIHGGDRESATGTLSLAAESASESEHV